MKIAIMGYSGGGKSTLAPKLGEKYGLPVLHMDSVHFLPNWVEKEREQEQRELAEFLDSHEGWVIDGNYSKVEQERRLREADRIIILELNRFVCLWRVLKRWRFHRGRVRPDMAEGCPEKVDGEFIRWVLHDGRTKDKKQAFDRWERQYPEKVLRIRSVKQQKDFLRRLEEEQ